MMTLELVHDRDARDEEGFVERTEHIAEDAMAASWLTVQLWIDWLGGWEEDARDLVQLTLSESRRAAQETIDLAEAQLRARSLESHGAALAEYASRRMDATNHVVEQVSRIQLRAMRRTVEPLRSMWRPWGRLFMRDLRRR